MSPLIQQERSWEGVLRVNDGIAAHTCNSSTCEEEAGDQTSQTSLDYLAIPYLKKKEKEEEEEEDKKVWGKRKRKGRHRKCADLENEMNVAGAPCKVMDNRLTGLMRKFIHPKRCGAGHCVSPWVHMGGRLPALLGLTTQYKRHTLSNHYTYYHKIKAISRQAVKDMMERWVLYYWQDSQWSFLKGRV